MNKKQIFYSYTDWTTLRGIGAGWIAQVHGYLPIGDWFQKAAMYQVAIWAMNIKWIPFWFIITALAGRFYLMMFVHWLVGRYVIKIGLLKAQQQYGAKTEQLSPYEKEHRETIKNIAKAVGAKIEYTDL